MTKFEIVVGNIADIKADAVVNAANPELAAGSGVCGAIFQKAGPGLAEEIAAEFPYGCPTGQAVTTAAYGLDAKFIIHAVAPIFEHHFDLDSELVSAYLSAMEDAFYRDVKSIAFPALGTGVYGWPIRQATRLAREALLEALQDYPEIETVTLSCFTEEVAGVYREVFARELAAVVDLVPRCEECGQKMVRIVYGLPSPVDYNKPGFVSGGCIISEDSPTWACAHCVAEDK
jgi:O-acetyl-ADP-ribose deacetylase (regulator of RNase III)